MKYLLYILWKFRSFIALIILLTISVILMIRYNDFKYTEYFRVSNSVNNITRNTVNGVYQFYNLKSENQELQEANVRLLDTILFYKKLHGSIDTTRFVNFLEKNSRFKSALVISNFPNNPNNMIVLNKGANDSIRKDMGVLSSGGIVGQVAIVSSDYSLVMPIINVNSRVSAKHKNSAQTCSVYWQGGSNNTLQITDIPIHANINVGDTILTSGYSAIYPKDIPIGIVQDIEKGAVFYNIDIKTTTDFGSLYTVYLFDNKEQTDIEELMKNLKK